MALLFLASNSAVVSVAVVVAVVVAVAVAAAVAVVVAVAVAVAVAVVAIVARTVWLDAVAGCYHFPAVAVAVFCSKCFGSFRLWL